MKKSSCDYKRKLEYQRYLAQEHPARLFDLSDCNLNEIPRDVFSFCKVLRKYSLNLSHNKLSSFGDEDKLVELNILCTLVLSYNSIKTIPKNISNLNNLQKIYLDNNRFTKFPHKLSSVPNLKLLHLQNNEIKIIPDKIQDFRSLEELNLSNNPISLISKCLCKLEKLKILDIQLDVVKDADFRGLSVEQFWEKLCKICSVNIRSISTKTSPAPERLKFKELNKTKIMKEYNTISQLYDAEIAKHDMILSNVDRQENQIYLDTVKKITEEEDKIIRQTLSKKYKMDRLLLNEILYEDIHPLDLIDKIKEINEYGRKMEELKQNYSSNSCEAGQENSVEDSKCGWSERIDIIDSMKDLLKKITEMPEEKSKFYFESEFIDLKLLNDYFISYKLDSDTSLQKSLYRVLLSDQDSKLHRLKESQSLVEKKLIQLSRIERSAAYDDDDVEDDVATGDNTGNDCDLKSITSRQQLVKLLQSLRKEVDVINKQLDEDVKSLEIMRNDLNIKTFWLQQFKRFQSLKHQTKQELESTLTQIGMEDLSPVFEKFDCNLNILLQLTDKDLTEIGIDAPETRKVLLSGLSKWKFDPIKSSTDPSSSVPSAPSLPSSTRTAIPSAPPLLSSSFASLSAPTPCLLAKPTPPTVLTAHKEQECCVCMNKEACMLFLNCGHVCCCNDCSPSVASCPLCRDNIVQIVSLNFS